MFTIVTVFLFFVVMINTLIAALANTYSLFEHGSQGLFLSKILMSRDELTYDKNYGAFLAS